MGSDQWHQLLACLEVALCPTLAARPLTAPVSRAPYLAERQGSYVVWPYMATTVGPGFLWAAVLSVTVQYFLNMEIERYTLATGETAVAGLRRLLQERPQHRAADDEPGLRLHEEDAYECERHDAGRDCGHGVDPSG